MRRNIAAVFFLTPCWVFECAPGARAESGRLVFHHSRDSRRQLDRGSFVGFVIVHRRAGRVGVGAAIARVCADQYAQRSPRRVGCVPSRYGFRLCQGACTMCVFLCSSVRFIARGRVLVSRRRACFALTAERASDAHAANHCRLYRAAARGGVCCRRQRRDAAAERYALSKKADAPVALVVCRV